MKKACSALLVAALAACSGGSGSKDPAPGARATLINAQGEEIGEAVFFQNATGVLIRTDLRKLPEGQHGFHVHAVGRCEPPFTSAGGHFNPAGRKHGLANPEGPHAGDMVNLVATADGTARTELMAAGFTLAALFDDDGSAVVVHASADDYRTDPTGNSGDRIACGVIRKP